MDYDWNFSILAPYKAALIRGTEITICLALLSSAIGTIIGIGIGWIFSRFPITKPLLIVNDALRSIPELVVLFFFYYFPYKQVLGIAPFSSFWCAVLALALSQAVFTAELVRAAVHTVATAPIVGGRALGVSEGDIWIHITLPAIIRQILPSLIAFWIGILKLSSLASIIGVEDAVFVAKVAVGQQFRSLEAWVTVAFIYVIIVTPLTLLARRFEQSAWLKRRA